MSDTKRLDFISEHGCDWDGLGAYINGRTYCFPTLRECIDAAMSDPRVDNKDALPPYTSRKLLSGGYTTLHVGHGGSGGVAQGGNGLPPCGENIGGGGKGNKECADALEKALRERKEAGK